MAQATGSLTPLVVDLDGTLTPSDTLVEAIVQVVCRRPTDMLWLPVWMMRGRAALKDRVASRLDFRPETLPYSDLLCRFLRAERGKGRCIVLATAANRRVAEAVAAHVALFDEVLASDARANLKGVAKLHAIRERVGATFAYAGDSRADLPIWKAADSAILVGASSAVRKAVRQHTRIELDVPKSPAGPAVWARQLRLHQWLKNLLLFVPLLTAFVSDGALVLTAALAFLSFSVAASATYVFNDLWDLSSDRVHPRKRNRPLASAQISIGAALAVACTLLVTALGMAWAIETAFFLLLVLYVVSTTAYSWHLKRYVFLDVVMLSALYTIRIIAGSAAVGVRTSVWLLAFSVFLFLSLALIKRCTELVTIARAGLASTHGRDYGTDDLVVLWPMGVGAGLCAVVVFALFVSVVDAEARYATPELLWLVGMGLICWLGRLWIKTARGEMHDDPLVYAIRDRGSRLLVAAMIATTIAAKFLHVGAL